MHDHGDGLDRPGRPTLTGQEPAPLSGRVAVPPAVRRTMKTWYASLTVTAFAVATMVLTRDGLANHLAELLVDRDPTISATTLDSASPQLILGVVGALVVVAVLEFALVQTFAARRPWPRFALLLMVAVHFVIGSLASLAVPTSAWQGWLLLVTLYLGVALAAAGAVQGLFPGVGAWLKERRSRVPVA